ncbi:TolC family protein [Bacteroidota bacterium]
MFLKVKFLSRGFISSITFLFVALALCGSFTELKAQEQQGNVFLTMEEAISLALVKNNLIKSSEYALKKAEWEQLNAWSLFLPTVSFNTRFTHLDEQTYQERDFRRYLPPEIANTIPQTVFQESYFTSIDVSAPLFNGGLINNLFIAGEAEELAEEMNKSTKDNVVFQVVSSYLGVLKSKDLLELQEDYLDLSKLNYEKAERLYKADRYSKTDALRWKLEFQQQKSTVVNSESLLRSSVRILNRLINKEFDENVRIEGNIPEHFIVESDNFFKLSDDEILEMINLTNDQLINANAQLAAAESNKDITELVHNNSYTTYLPNVSIAYSYGWRENGTLALDDYSPKTLLLNFSWPIFSGFQDYTKLKSSYYDYKQSEEEFNDQLLNTKYLLTETANKIINLKTQKELAKTNLEFSENNYNIVSQQKEKGLISNIDFIDAKLNWQNAKLNEVNTHYDFMAAIIELYYLLGKIDTLVDL